MKKLIQTKFAKNLLTLTGGNLVAQIITLGTVVVTTRLYTPANFGDLALFVAVIGILSKIGTLCYERALVISKNDGEALNVLVLCFLALIIITAATAISLLGSELLGVEWGRRMGSLRYFIPLGLFLIGSIKVLNFWLLRGKEFKLLAVSRCCNAFSSAIVKILIGFFAGAGSGGLFAGFIVGMVVTLYVYFKSPSIVSIKDKINYISRKRIIYSAIIHRKFPLFSTCNAVLNEFSQNIIIFMFYFYFSPQIVGFYSVGTRVLQQPIALLAESIQNVYFQRAGHDFIRGKNLMYTYSRLTFFLCILGVLPFGILFFGGGWIFTCIFGQSWSVAGSYIEVLSPWFFLVFVRAPSNVVYEVLSKQDLRLFLNIFKFLAIFVTLLVGNMIYGEPIKMLRLFCYINVILELLTIGVAYLVVRKG